MNLPFGVIDSDGHINEPEDELRSYIEGPYGEIKNSIHRYIPNASGSVGGGILVTHSSFDTTLGASLARTGLRAIPRRTIGWRRRTRAACPPSASFRQPFWPTPSSPTTTIWSR